MLAHRRPLYALILVGNEIPTRTGGSLRCALSTEPTSETRDWETPLGFAFQEGMR